MESTSIDATLDMFGLNLHIGPNEMLLILLGLFALVGIFVIVMVLRKKLG
jgi:hypothetical protein